MAVALQQEPVEPATEIIAALAQARNLPYPALRHAFERADEVAPAVIDVVAQAARGVFLMPGQYNLLFWGIHAVAAARRTELHRPVLDLIRQAQEDLVNLLGDAVEKTLKKIVISTFDGDPEPLIAACSDKNLDGFVRWYLMLALARLTFDGRIPRETTLAFLRRFEQECLADPGDAAWDGWQDAIIYLGVEEMRDRLRATWTDDRNPHKPQRQDHFERLMSIAQGLAPGDDTLFSEEDIVPLGDPEDDLEWTTRPRYDRDEEELDPKDPAGAFVLKRFERDWLHQFLRSCKVPQGTMTLEQIDGLFSALIAGPAGARIDDCLRTIWNADPAADNTPSYDSPEQTQYVDGLLRRHWTTIGLRLERAYPHVPIFASRLDPWRGRRWAASFFVGISMRETEWSLRLGEEAIGVPARAIASLAMDPARLKKDGITLDLRETLIRMLPERLVALHHAWRGRDDPFPPAAGGIVLERKVGRNERCPCGSGKKYKRCCGSP
jgi:yecA family protein